MIINPLPKGLWGIGTDGISAREGMHLGLLGFAGLGVNLERDDPFLAAEHEDPYIFHFPDGNAGITRLLVRQLVPAVAPGETMQDVVQARFNYSVLDRESNPVKIRLSATVVNVSHPGDIESADSVNVRYVKNDVAHQVRARNVI